MATKRRVILSAGEWEDLPKLADLVQKKRGVRPGTAVVSYSSSGNIKVMLPEYAASGLCVIAKGDVPQGERKKLTALIEAKGVRPGYSSGVLAHYRDRVEEVLRRMTGIEDIRITSGNSSFSIRSAAIGQRPLTIPYTDCPDFDPDGAGEGAEFAAQMILAAQKMEISNQKRRRIAGVRDSLWREAAKRVVAYAAEELQLELTYTGKAVELQLGERTLLLESRSQFLPDADGDYLILTDDAGEEKVVYDPAVGKDAEKKFVQYLRKAKFVPKSAADHLEEEKEVRALLKECADLADPLYNGAKRPADTVRCRYFMEDQSFHIESAVYSLIVKDGKVRKKEPDEAWRALRHLRSLKRYQACRDFAEETCRKMQLELAFQKGKGLLLGSTDIRATSADGTFTGKYTFDMPPFNSSVTVWKKCFLEQMEGVRAAYTAMLEEKERKVLAAIGPFAGDFLAEDIAEFVKTNERYITQNAIIQALRGVQVRLDTFIRATPGTGRYAMVDGDTIGGLEDRMERAGILRSRKLSGHYGDFYVIKTGPYADSLLERRKRTFGEEETGDLIAALKEGKALTDRQALTVFEHLERTGKEQGKQAADYVLAMKLAGNKGFVCRYQERYTAYFADMPKEVRAVLRMQKETTKDPFRLKALRMLLRRKGKAGEDAPEEESEG